MGDGRGEQPTLPGVAAEAAEPAELGGGFDGFGGDGEPEDVREPNDGGHDFHVDVVGFVVAAAAAGDERSGEFEGVHGQPPQVGQVGVAGAEVVDGDAYTEVGQVAEDGEGVLGGAHELAFGEFELQQLGGPSGVREDLDDVGDEAGFADLPDGQVHAHQQSHAGVGGPPSGGLPAGVGEDGAAERDDEPGVLGQRDELGGFEPFAGGQLPADQRFHPGGLLVLQPDQRLVLDDEFAVGQRVGHPRGQREPADVDVVAFGVEQGVPVTAVGLGPVHGGVGGLHQFGGAAGAVVGVLHDADAGRDDDRVAADDDGAAHGVQRGLRDPLQVVDPGAVLDQDHELVAAHPCHQVTVAAEFGAQPLGDGPQQRVAGVMAQGVVDGLEVVEVQVADPDRVLRGAGLKRGIEAVEEQRPVG